MSTGEQIFYIWLLVGCIMLVLWAIQYKTENAGTVDVAWSFCTGLTAAALALMSQVGSEERHMIIAVLAALWGIRLGMHILSRVMNETEDGRYRHMRLSSGNYAQPVMFVFFQIQASWVILFALPMWAAAQAPATELRIWDFIGIAIWLVAMAGEWLSDKQLSEFRQNPDNKGKVCQVGLWRFSRHPNYFFEWLHWLAYVFIGIGSAYWWVCVAAVVVMYIFITKITGIPFTEQQSIRSRGDAYREYQKTTSSFFPLPPKTV